MNIAEAKEYGEVTLSEEQLDENEKSHLEETIKQKAESESSKKEKNKKMLGLHIDEGEPKAHWFVGQVWIDSRKGLVLRVNPKFDEENQEISAFHMYLKCLGDPVVSAHLENTFDFWTDEPFIPVNDTHLQMELTPLIVTMYLQLLHGLCKRHICRTDQKKEENLIGRIKGRPVIPAQIRQNVTKGRMDRMVCQFSQKTMDNNFNQILKAALEQCLKWLRRYSYKKVPLLWDMAAFCSVSLNNVSLRRISTLDFKGIRYSGFLKHYREPHQWARLILQHLGYDPLQELQEPFSPALPPFAIDMNELFERYCEVYLRKNYGDKMWVGYQDENLGKSFLVPVRPDYLINEGETKWIVDAKYKKNWSGKEQHDDIYQVLAYSRHKKVLEELNMLQSSSNEVTFCDTCQRLKIMILYPDSKPCDDWESFNLDLNASNEHELEDFTVGIKKMKIPLPPNPK